MHSLQRTVALPQPNRVAWLLWGVPWAALIVVATLAIIDSAAELMLPHYPVTGSVTLAGEIPVGAEVVFHPMNPHGWAGVAPHGIVGEDGSFKLSSFGVDGAIPGEYAVTISHTPWDFEPYSKLDTTPLKARVDATDNHVGCYELECRCRSEINGREQLAKIALR